jgi:hypothetical protein
MFHRNSDGPAEGAHSSTSCWLDSATARRAPNTAWRPIALAVHLTLAGVLLARS